MGNFIRQHRKAFALAVLALGVILTIVVRPGVQTEPSVTPPTVEQPAVLPDAGKTPTGIVRAGYVGTPTRLPINSGFDGQVSEVYVREGQTVKAGEPLFKLVVAAQRTGSSAAAPPSNENALRDYNRLLKLYEQGIITRRELENAETRRPGLTPKNSSSGPGVPVGPTITTAPIAGVVAELAVAAGNSVQAGQRILFLGSGQSLEVVVPLEQQELYRVQPGVPATVEISGATVKGEVVGIFPEVKDNAVASFLAHISLVNPPDGLLQAGMAVNVRIETGP